MKKLIKKDYHRNGIGGTGFFVVIFKDDDGSKKIGIVFNSEDECCTAVFDKDLLDKDVIEFGANSWRGDNYFGDLKKMIEEEDVKKMHYDKAALELLNYKKETLEKEINEMSDEELEDEYEQCFNEKIKIIN